MGPGRADQFKSSSRTAPAFLARTLRGRMSVVQMSTQLADGFAYRLIPTDGAGRMPVLTHRLRPRPIEEALMPSKLRRTQITLHAKAYRSAVALAGLLVLLEALGAPRKL